MTEIEKEINELKVRAYDLIADKEQAQRDLDIVNKRIVMLYQEIKNLQAIKANE